MSAALTNRIRRRRRARSIPVWTIARVILAGVLVEGFLYGIVTSSDGLGPNLITEAMGIGFTVLVIDWIYEQRSKRELKRRLIREAGSRLRGIAIPAVEWLRAE